ncbi:MAG: SH3 domain-containing protein [Treponema sp.]|nr:SH3 domain-containing protein [Treponema sp.]
MNYEKLMSKKNGEGKDAVSKSASSLDSKTSQKTISSNSTGKKSNKIPFISAVIGFILGIVLILIVSNLPREFPEKPSVQKAAVASNTLSLRVEPNNNAEVLKTLSFGNIVEIIGEEIGDFTPVEYEGIQGWVLSALIVSD